MHVYLPKKTVVLGFKEGEHANQVVSSRTATLGLYDAFKILGYKPYHMAEIAYNLAGNGPVIYKQALLAENNRWSHYEPLGRPEFDKWLEDYDALLELPCYIPMQTVHAYLNDPDVKFILTERSPDSWVKSFNGFVGKIVDITSAFPMSLLKYFNLSLYRMWYLNILMYDMYSNNTRRGHPDNQRFLRANYVQYIDLIKKLIPPERLHVIKLEDGIGWDKICGYLEKPIPDVPYPVTDNHHEIMKPFFAGLVRTAFFNMAATLIPVVGLGLYLGRKHLM